MKEPKGVLSIVVNGKEWRFRATQGAYDYAVRSADHGRTFNVGELVIFPRKVDSIGWVRPPKKRSQK